MFKFSNWSLLKKSLFGLNVISVVLLLSVTSLAFRQLDKQGRASLSLKVLSLTDFVKHAASHAFWNFDVEVLKIFSDQLVKDNDIIAIEFYDKTGKNDIYGGKASYCGLTFFRTFSFGTQ